LNSNPHPDRHSTLILCLGNEVISDDGFGAEVAEALGKDSEVIARAEVVFAPVAGFALLDFLEGRKRVLIVDSIQTGNAFPGTLHRFNANVFAPGRNLIGSHQISLPTALEFGRRLGLAMPENIDILAVEASDLETLHQGLTPFVQASLLPATRLAREWVGCDTLN